MNKFVSPYEKMDEVRVNRSIPSTSETVPDQSLGIKEILRRSMAGIPSVGNPNHYYDGDTTDYDTEDYDLTDIDPETTIAYKQSDHLERMAYGDVSD